MRRVKGQLNKKIYLLSILAFMVVTDIAIYFNIPFVRQTLGLIFLSLFPGLLLLQILNIKKLDLSLKIVLSIGTSLVILMISGLIFDQVSYAMGLQKPLATFPLTVFFNVVTIGLALILYFKKEAELFDFNDFKLDAREKAFLILPVLLPLFSLIGIYLMNNTDNNLMVIAVLIAIPLYVVITAIWRKHVTDKIYPIVIVMISLSLMLIIGLRSSHIVGMDQHSEYNLFRLISNNQHWSLIRESDVTSTLSSCLSVTLLPTIFQSYLNIDQEYLYRIILLLITAITPLAVYLITKNYIHNWGAFVASFFFMAQSGFLLPAGRTRIAILFFSLLILVFFNKKLGGITKNILLVTFMGGVVISHYSTSYIALMVLLLTWIAMKMVKRFNTGKKQLPDSTAGTLLLSENVGQVEIPSSNNAKSGPNVITGSLIVLLTVMIFFWTGEIAGSPLNGALQLFTGVFKHINEIFLVESRGEASVALGSSLSQNNMASTIEFIFSWLTIIFIAAGLFFVLFKRKRYLALSNEEKADELNVINSQIYLEYYILAIVCFAILATAIILPFVFSGYGMARAYLQMTPILAIFLVIGGVTLAEVVRIHRRYAALLIVVIVYFLCTTGMTAQMFNNPRSINLNSSGPEYETYYIHAEEVNSAKWFASHKAAVYDKIFVDVGGGNVLASQGGITENVNRTALFDLKNKSELDFITYKIYIYLTYNNVVEGTEMDTNYVQQSLANFQDKFNNRSKVYSDGGSEVWR